ncbi:hypothetical protein ASD88_13025 [Pelomonas sp. Root662]|nr:hypothetical protein ASC81_13025 [Pelomonas sp. Root405]KRA72646.1 hypothetical protein ASD88_13025 [Pelomonas sp. Root662]
MSITKRSVRIAGEPNSGWSAADPDDLNAIDVEFSFRIISDGNANYLLLYESGDKRYGADTWHPTVEEAMAAAQQFFGIEPGEWVAG